MGTPSVFPMGTTIYDPEKAWSGYTIMPIVGTGAVLIDMNGNVVKPGVICRASLTNCCLAVRYSVL